MTTLQSRSGPKPGRVRIDPLFEAPEPARIRVASVTFEPGARSNRHSAAPNSALTHLALQEFANGKVVGWMENVTDEQYPLIINILDQE